jgi:hypothetical protein
MADVLIAAAAFRVLLLISAASVFQDRRKRERRDKEHQRHGHGAFTLRRITENLKNHRPGKPTTKAACVQEGRCHHRPYRKRGYHVVIQLDFAFRVRQRAKRML